MPIKREELMGLKEELRWGKVGVSLGITDEGVARVEIL